MATAIGDHIRWYHKTWVPQRVSELEHELVPGGDAFSHHAERVAAAIFGRTGLAPSEYRKLNAGGKLVWLEKVCPGYGPHDAEKPDPPLLERVLDILTPQQCRIFEAIYKSETQSMSFDKLATIQKAWRSLADDEAIDKALKRLNTRLAENDDLAVTLSISVVKRRVKLEFLRDK